MIVLTELISSQIKIPFLSYEKDAALQSATVVNIIVFLYEFHILEFRIKLIGLSIALIIFFFIGVVTSIKVLEIFRPILGILDVAESINEISDSNNYNK